MSKTCILFDHRAGEIFTLCDSYQLTKHLLFRKQHNERTMQRYARTQKSFELSGFPCSANKKQFDSSHWFWVCEFVKLQRYINRKANYCFSISNKRRKHDVSSSYQKIFLWGFLVVKSMPNNLWIWESKDDWNLEKIFKNSNSWYLFTSLFSSMLWKKYL